jgi:hypothetical protein
MKVMHDVLYLSFPISNVEDARAYIRRACECVCVRALSL